MILKLLITSGLSKAEHDKVNATFALRKLLDSHVDGAIALASAKTLMVQMIDHKLSVEIDVDVLDQPPDLIACALAELTDSGFTCSVIDPDEYKTFCTLKQRDIVNTLENGNMRLAADHLELYVIINGIYSS